MRLVEVQRQADRLNALVALAEAQRDLQLQARLTEFICVRTAGFVEQSIQSIYFDFVRLRSPISVSSFVSRRLARVQNIKSERLRELVRDFDASWATGLDAFLTDERKQALNSVVTNRNKVAHGESVSIGLVQMKRWLSEVLEIVAFLEEQCV